jgi:hypothetical protein
VTRQQLLAEAERRDCGAEEIAQRIEDGEDCLDSLLTYRRQQARHLRHLAARAESRLNDPAE